MTLPPPVTEMERALTEQEREARRERVPRFFSRENWHWTIVLDCYALARLRWGGVVPEGSRDLFGHVIACQMARIVRPETLYQEIAAAVSSILPANYMARDLRSHCSTLLRLAQEAANGSDWALLYRYGKSALIDKLQITPAEERQMQALISDTEKARRHAEAEMARRRAAGAMERALYENRATERRETARLLRSQGLGWAAVAERMALPSADTARMLASRP